VLPEKILILFNPPHDSRELPVHPKLHSAFVGNGEDESLESQSAGLAIVDGDDDDDDEPTARI